MKLVVQIKLVPSAEQAKVLLHTLEVSNAACDKLAQIAWDTNEFRRFPLHKLCYRQIRDEFPLSAETVILAIAKVTDAYKLDRKVQRVFRKHGSIAYDCKILKIYVLASLVSIWTLNGREKIQFVCGEKQRELLKYPKGESDLILKNEKWFLNVTVEVPEDQETVATDILGVDFGIANVAYDSDGKAYSGSTVNKIRHRNRALRRKLRRKGTKSAKRLLRKRRRKESLYCRNQNHIISKRIVQTAKRTNRGIAVEDLTGILTRIRASKRQRTKLHSWSFAQLGGFIRYKAQLAGVPFFEVDPRNTSRRCLQCGHTSKKNRKSQSEFDCEKCGHSQHADGIGAGNIRLKGLKLLSAGATSHPDAEEISYGGNHGRTHLQVETAV